MYFIKGATRSDSNYYHLLILIASSVTNRQLPIVNDRLSTCNRRSRRIEADKRR
ncbi:MAG: hypothetical protein ACRC62_29765 [Microcoleus sp.]